MTVEHDQSRADAVPQTLAVRPLPHGIPADNLAALPAAPGVYVFHGVANAMTDAPPLPLYIGKSINIRARVLSHLRTPEEARMLAQSRRVDWRRTAGEVGALLLESQLIKAHQPLFNQRLRRSRQLCAWQVDSEQPSQRPVLRFSRELDFATAPHLFGLYSSPTQAKAALMSLASSHGLCLAILGLEPAARRGCFARQLGRCAGACVGLETAQAHLQRLRAALAEQAVHRWPFDGPMALVERDGGWTQTHVVDAWRHLGTWDSEAPPGMSSPGALVVPGAKPAAFDVDAYRILVKPLLSGQGEWQPVRQLPAGRPG
jgi:excinuclease Cho